MEKTDRIKELIKILSEENDAYYMRDKPVMSDKEYDDLYDELADLEDKVGVILAGSPTQKVQGRLLPGLKKVKHSKPMLSTAKPKDPEEIKRFLDKNEFYGSFKLDGITLVTRYSNGNFIGAYTRGNGELGEDVTEQARFISNLPLKISEKQDIELRGECVISWDEFRKINESLDEPYSHPRNLAAGSIRNLDTLLVKDRHLSYVVFETITGLDEDNKLESLTHASNIGFETVKRSNNEVDSITDSFQPNKYPYPVDGIIFEITSKKYSGILGSTSHHENCRMALKWEDELHETILTGIEWQTSKTGLVNPVAIFEAVDLDGAVTTKATLHNLSYIEEKQLGIGDKITVYRANMVIPKVHESLTKSGKITIPDKCPCCGYSTEVHCENGSKTLHCVNGDCPAQIISKLRHFCSKEAMDIEGLSEGKLEKILTVVDLQTFNDIYNLEQHYDSLVNIEGLGKKSIDKMLSEIKNSKKVKFKNFVNALSIPGVGYGTSKLLSEFFNESWEEFSRAIDHRFDFSQIDNIGDVTNKGIYKWVMGNYTNTLRLTGIMEFQKEEAAKDDKFHNFHFAVTGKLKNYSSRNQLKKDLESYGATVNDTVTKTTTFLINNDSKSNSSKNKRAAEYGVKIITEDEAIRMMEKY